MSRQEAKRLALDSLKGNWGYAILITVLYMIISAALGAAGGIGTLLLGSALLVGFYYAFINLSA